MTIACPRCSHPVRDDARFCDACGSALPVAGDENAPTVGSPPRVPTSRRNDPRFLPGSVLERRYRIVAPLGRGGMGEVYRADDLKLGQAVALKFLPRSLEQDAERRALLLDEVKLARQVSHPNVCRVWDAGETDGLHYVAMEYVDGEDLGSLLRRIGRLPEERGIQVAREICAGLAAIHEQGVLHRDLKPSNIMLDGRGRVRIADFGLATLAHAAAGDASRSGTPAYMAPEQLDGLGASDRSDVYALGLVLYEVFTGRHAFASERTPSRRENDSRPETPSSHVRSLDPVVERAILRCLEPDPALRPASALAVANALPGGNPLLSALMAGETPSPEMVAASGGAGGLRPAVALGLLAAFALGLIGVIAVAERRGLPFGPEDRSHAALRDRADDWARALGGAHAGDDVVDGYSVDDAMPSGTKSRSGTPEIFYWYRRSPVPVPRVMEERTSRGESQFALPALDVPGSLALRCDLRGRLLEFRRFPAAADTMAESAPDWRPFFGAAGLVDPRPSPIAPQIVPPVPARTSVAWTAASSAGTRGVEAGTYGGRVTFFTVGAPYVAVSPDRGAILGSTFGSVFELFLLGLVIYFARRNLLEGRADARGAVRLSTVGLVLGSLGFVFLPYPQSLVSGRMLFLSMAIGLFFTALAGFSYLALEPIVRRRHPEWLVSWARFLDGRWRDRLVGRDLLIGFVAGALAALVGEIQGLLVKSVPSGDFESAAMGGWSSTSVAARGIAAGALIPMMLALILTLLQRATRRNWLGWLLWTPIAVLFLWRGPTAGLPWAPLLEAAILGFVLHRLGLLSMFAASIVFGIFNDEYLTTHLGAWYGSATVASLLVTGTLAVWAAMVAARAPRGDARAGG
jgi:serine/threonine-protein kinase